MISKKGLGYFCEKKGRNAVKPNPLKNFLMNISGMDSLIRVYTMSSFSYTTNLRWSLSVRAVMNDTEPSPPQYPPVMSDWSKYEGVVFIKSLYRPPFLLAFTLQRLTAGYHTHSVHMLIRFCTKCKILRTCHFFFFF